MQLLTISDLCERLHLTRVSIYRRVKNDPTFPQPFYVAARCPRWRAADVDRWIDELATKAAENAA